MRQARRRLDNNTEVSTANKLLGVIARRPEFRCASRVALYLAHGGEIDPAPIKRLAEISGKRCFLPALHPLKYNRFYFLPHQSGQVLQSNRFGIEEPPLHLHRIAPAWTMDIIFLPLVAFDRTGNRLGMGGGFYDSSLAFVRRKSGRTPLLIGLAHSFQQVDELEPAVWDIPLHAVATEREFIWTSDKRI